MTTFLNSIDVKHERRVRLIFSRALLSGAFGVPEPAGYVITCQVSLGVDPGISAAMIVSGNPNIVELALAGDLVQGSLYLVSAVGIPGSDSSTTPNPTELKFRYGFTAPVRDAEPILQNRDSLLYGVDLLWNGEDYQETASGDLDTIGGTANVQKALYRGIESEGLTWDQTYGARARDFVDSPSTSASTLKGRVQAQVLRDPRIKSAKVDISTDGAETQLVITPVLISGDALKQVSIVV